MADAVSDNLTTVMTNSLGTAEPWRFMVCMMLKMAIF
jgi:hypothetical protein